MANFFASALEQQKAYGWQVAEQIGGEFSGSLKFAGVVLCFGIPCCGCGCEKNRPYTFSNNIKIGSTTENMSKTALRPPRGERWESAKPGMETILQEVDGLVASEVSGFPMISNHRHLKTVLENRGWLGRVQTYLKQHSLFADLAVHPHEELEGQKTQDEWGNVVDASYYSEEDGDPALLLRIFTLSNAPSQDLPQQMNMESTGGV